MLAQKRKLREESEDIVRKFGQSLSFIIETGAKKLSRDSDFGEVREQFLIAKRNNPEDLIKLSGPPIWQYREQIKNGDIQHFLEKDFTEDIESFGKDESGHSVSREELEKSAKLVQNIKKTWTTCSKKEQSILVKKVQILLSLYARHLSVEKKLSDLE